MMLVFSCSFGSGLHWLSVSSRPFSIGEEAVVCKCCVLFVGLSKVTRVSCTRFC